MNQKLNSKKATRVYMWQNGLCITYLLIFRKFQEFLKANGWEIVNKPADAEWIVTGACGSFLPVIDDYLRHIESYLRGGKKVLVYGCLPKITPERYHEYEKRANLLIPPERPELIEELIPNARVRWSDIPNNGEFRREDYRNYDPTRKYVLIQYGCSIECTYCPHVKGIGKNVSRSKKEVINEVNSMLNNGAKTIFLEGRDIGSWGIDLKQQDSFPSILEEILTLPGNFDVYVNQFGANWAVHYGKRLFELFENPKIRDVHIPIQTTSERLLTLMGRNPNVKKLSPLLKSLRVNRPNLMLRTDLIIGFPTETEEELNDTLEFVKEHFDEVACHGLELHPNTKLMEMKLPFFDQSLIEERVERARKYLEESGVVAHRGGQVFKTMVKRERVMKKKRGRTHLSRGGIKK
ncbi:MAG: radical SAM protein [Candidatus Altiarchaeota archaeon]